MMLLRRTTEKQRLSALKMHSYLCFLLGGHYLLILTGTSHPASKNLTCLVLMCVEDHRKTAVKPFLRGNYACRTLKEKDTRNSYVWTEVDNSEEH